MLYQDIPRIYTAIAEWGAVSGLSLYVERRKMKICTFFYWCVAHAGIAVCFSGCDR